MKYRIKIVPKADPNAEGEWLEVETAPMPERKSWRQAELWFAKLVPSTHFLVKVEDAS